MLHKKTQEEIALMLLKKRPLDTVQATEVGIYRLSAVIFRLKKRGFKFEPVKRIKTKNHIVAQYKLKK